MDSVFSWRILRADDKEVDYATFQTTDFTNLVSDTG